MEILLAQPEVRILESVNFRGLGELASGRV